MSRLPDFAFRATLCLGVSEISIYDSYISETREMDVRWIATISALALTAAMPAEAREVQALADGWSFAFGIGRIARPARSAEHTSELQSLMRHSYAAFRLKKK